MPNHTWGCQILITELWETQRTLLFCILNVHKNINKGHVPYSDALMSFEIKEM